VISNTHKLKVTIKIVEDKLRVTNNLQPKFTTEPSTSFGLESLRQRYEMLSTEPLLVTSDNYFFSVELPLLETTADLHKNGFLRWIF